MIYASVHGTFLLTECQIWFQNRRQSSRRKARPLFPHEVVQYHAQKAGLPVPSHDASFVPPNFGSDDSNATIPDENLTSESDPLPHGPDHVLRAPPPRETAPRGGTPNPQDPQLPREGNFSAFAAYQAMRQDEHALPSSKTQAASSNVGLGYLANKRRGSSFHGSQDIAEPYEAPAPEPAARRNRPLRKSTSSVRLSMTSEGGAKVITKDSSSPSPPRPSQGSQQSFSNSQGPSVSALNLGEGSAGPAAKRLRRSTSGRSRDSRAWEFWCDKDSRTEQEEAAEKDGSGSAADAIGLIRANSGRRVLGAIPNKRNSLMTRPQPSTKGLKTQRSRPSLQRSYTSAGRLQQGKPDFATKQLPKLKYSDSAASISIPGNDSDKENWTPDRELAASQPVIPMAPPNFDRIQGTVLGERRVTGNPPQRTLGKGSGDRENRDPENDPELAAFMRSERKSNSISEDEELDCVQGLLSLSQGNWR